MFSSSSTTSTLGNRSPSVMALPSIIPIPVRERLSAGIAARARFAGPPCDHDAFARPLAGKWRNGAAPLSAQGSITAGHDAPAMMQPAQSDNEDWAPPDPDELDRPAPRFLLTIIRRASRTEPFSGPPTNSRSPVARLVGLALARSFTTTVSLVNVHAQTVPSAARTVTCLSLAATITPRSKAIWRNPPPRSRTVN